MGLQTLDDQGNMTWNCHNGCGEQQAHISHAAIQWHAAHPETKPEHQMVSMPPCRCGSQMFLKVSFTEAELKAPNMWLEWNSARVQALQKLQSLLPQAEPGSAQQAVLQQQIAELEKIRDAGGLHTESHAMALRHVELARQLVASGKKPVGYQQGE